MNLDYAYFLFDIFNFSTSLYILLKWDLDILRDIASWATSIKLTFLYIFMSNLLFFQKLYVNSSLITFQKYAKMSLLCNKDISKNMYRKLEIMWKSRITIYPTWNLRPGLTVVIMSIIRAFFTLTCELHATAESCCTTAGKSQTQTLLCTVGAT